MKKKLTKEQEKIKKELIKYAKTHISHIHLLQEFFIGNVNQFFKELVD